MGVLVDLDQLRTLTVLLSLCRDQSTGKAGGDDRNVRALLQQPRDSTDVVLVAVGDDQSVHAVPLALQVAEVRQDQVHARLTGAREQHTTVDDQQAAFVLKDRHVAADLGDTAQRDDTQAALRLLRRLRQALRQVRALHGLQCALATVTTATLAAAVVVAITAVVATVVAAVVAVAAATATGTTVTVAVTATVVVLVAAVVGRAVVVVAVGVVVGVVLSDATVVENRRSLSVGDSGVIRLCFRLSARRSGLPSNLAASGTLFSHIFPIPLLLAGLEPADPTQRLLVR